MTFVLRIIAIVAALGLITSCGFSPVYAKRERQLDTSDVLAQIHITTPGGRHGDQLKAGLEDRFHLNDKPHSANSARYQLDAGLRIAAQPFIIDPDGISSRYEVTLRSEYVLRRRADALLLDKGQLTRKVSYNVSESDDYGTYIAEKDAIRRGIDALAQAYQLRLAALIANQLQQP